MRRVTYCRTGDTVLVNSFNVDLRFPDGSWKHGRWSMTNESFEGLRRANPDKEFVEDCGDSN